MGESSFDVVPVVIAAVALLVGVMQVVVGVAGVRRARQTKRVAERALPARATVVGVRLDRRLNSDGINRTDEWTTVRYAHPRTEAVHEVEMPVPNGLRGRRPGEEVDVVVDPEDPAMVLPPKVHSGFVLAVSGFFVLVGTAVVVAVLWYAATRTLITPDDPFPIEFPDPAAP